MGRLTKVFRPPDCPICASEDTCLYVCDFNSPEGKRYMIQCHNCDAKTIKYHDKSVAESDWLAGFIDKGQYENDGTSEKENIH